MIAVPSENDLRTITEQVWYSYLDPEGNRPLIPIAAPRQPAEVSAAVALTGAWAGRVVIACTAVAARYATMAMLGIAEADVAEADVTDALGELANIIGGGVKGLLPEPCALSLPLVVTGDAATEPASAGLVCRLSARWIEESVTVSLLANIDKSVGVSAP